MRTDVNLKTRDGTGLSGWFYPPDGEDSAGPCVVMTHGLSGQIEFGLAPYAECLQAAGIGVLMYDHRGWGSSGGSPRMESNPYCQMQDTRDAITFAATLPRVDGTRIGLWGTSLSGGTALMVAAVDRRVRSVVAVCPFVSGSGVLGRLLGERGLREHLDTAAEARRAEMVGAGVQYRQLTGVGETIEAFRELDSGGQWQNRISMLSYDMMLEFEPGDFVHRIAPTPLLMIVPSRDTRVPTDLQQEAFQRALEPKHLVVIEGGHYDPYLRRLGEVCDATRDWFVKTLIGGGRGSVSPHEGKQPSP